MSAQGDDDFVPPFPVPTSYRATVATVVAYLEARLAAAEGLLDQQASGTDPFLAERMRQYWQALRDAGPVENWASEAWRKYGMMP